MLLFRHYPSPPSMNPKKFVTVFSIVFSLAGVGLLAMAGFSVVSEYRFLSQASRATGTVVDMEAGTSRRSSSRGSSGSQPVYYPIVGFTTDAGQAIRFRGSVGSNPPGFQRGDTIKVVYPASQPEDAQIDSFMQLWFFSLITGGMGILFFAAGLSVLVYGIMRRRQMAWLTQNGQRIQADITGIFVDSSYTVNGQNPFRIAAQWQNPIDQSIRTFQSEAIWFDPTAFVKTKKIDVLINPSKAKHYLVDLSFLPKEA